MKTNIFSKILLVLMSGILILSGIGIGTASASTSTSVSENENVQEPITPIGIQPAAGSTKVVKVAIKEALNNKAKIVKTARVWIGNDAANQIDKYFTKATPTLNKLLKYESLAWKTVQDQVRNGLVAAKVKRTTAESVAYWIRLALEWMI